MSSSAEIRAAIVDQPIGAGRDEIGIGQGRAQAQSPVRLRPCQNEFPRGHLQPRRNRRAAKPERASPLDIRLGMRLAVGDVAGGDHDRRNRKSGGPNPHFRQRAGAGGDNRPAIRRQGSQQLESSGKGHDSPGVLDLAAFDLAVLGFVVGIGQQLPDDSMLGRPWASRTVFSGSKPCSIAHCVQTRATAGVESIKTPSRSNNMPLAVMTVILK